MKDLAGQISHFVLAAIASITATANGASVDLQQYQGSLSLILDADNTAGTDPTLDVKVQDSADDSAWADVTGAVFAQAEGDASKQTLRIHTREVGRYIRVVKTIGGTSSPAFLLSINGVGTKQVRS